MTNSSNVFVRAFSLVYTRWHAGEKIARKKGRANAATGRRKNKTGEEARKKEREPIINTLGVFSFKRARLRRMSFMGFYSGEGWSWKWQKHNIRLVNVAQVGSRLRIRFHKVRFLAADIAANTVFAFCSYYSYSSRIYQTSHFYLFSHFFPPFFFLFHPPFVSSSYSLFCESFNEGEWRVREMANAIQFEKMYINFRPLGMRPPSLLYYELVLALRFAKSRVFILFSSNQATRAAFIRRRPPYYFVAKQSIFHQDFFGSYQLGRTWLRSSFRERFYRLSYAIEGSPFEAHGGQLKILLPAS